MPAIVHARITQLKMAVAAEKEALTQDPEELLPIAMKLTFLIKRPLTI